MLTQSSGDIILDTWDSGSLGTRGQGDDRDMIGTPPGPVSLRLVATGLVVETAKFGWSLKWRQVNTFRELPLFSSIFLSCQTSYALS